MGLGRELQFGPEAVEPRHRSFVPWIDAIRCFLFNDLDHITAASISAPEINSGLRCTAARTQIPVRPVMLCRIPSLTVIWTATGPFEMQTAFELI